MSLAKNTEKVNFDQLWDFQIFFLLFLHTLLLCHSLDAGFPGVHFVGPDLGSNSLQRLSADKKSHP